MIYIICLTGLYLIPLFIIYFVWKDVNPKPSLEEWMDTTESRNLQVMEDMNCFYYYIKNRDKHSPLPAVYHLYNIKTARYSSNMISELEQQYKEYCEKYNMEYVKPKNPMSFDGVWIKSKQK